MKMWPGVFKEFFPWKITRTRRGVFYQGLWVLLLMAGFGVALYGSIQVSTSFVNQDPATTYKIESQPVMQQPDIFLCFHMKFSLKRAKDFLAETIDKNYKDTDLVEKFLFYLGKAMLPSVLTSYIEAEQAVMNEDYADLMAALLDRVLETKKLTLAELIKEVSPKCEDFLFVWRPGLSKNIHSPCSEMNITYAILPQGICMRVPGKKQFGAIYASETSFEMYIPSSMFHVTKTDLYLKGMQLVIPDIASNVGGVNKLDHNYDSVYLLPGHHNRVSVKYQKMSITRSKKLDCIDTANYTHSTCFTDCIIDIYNLKCLPVTFIHLASSKYLKMRTCSPAENQKFMEEGLTTHDNFRTCNTKCKIPCHKVLYEPTISYSPFWNNENMVPYGYFPDDKMFVDLYYSRLTSVEVTNFFATDTFGFISNLGGTFGLWVGASILSITHAISYCFAYCCCKLAIRN